MEYYQHTISADPKYTDAYLNIAAIYKQKNQTALAITTLENALTQIPGNKKVLDMLGSMKSEIAGERYKLAMEKHNKGEYDGAIKEYNRIIAISEPDPDLFINLGAAYQAANKHDEAITAYKKAISLDNKKAMAYYYLGTAYTAKSDNLNALKAYRKALELSPNDENIENGIATSKNLLSENLVEEGISFYDKGNYAQALLKFNTGLMNDPENPDLYYNRGMVYDALKKYPLAIADYKQALKYDAEIILAYYAIAVDYDTVKNYIEAKKWYQKFILKSQNENEEYLKYAKKRILQL
jgi:tetratricopeptide (TPR) repeat protein